MAFIFYICLECSIERSVLFYFTLLLFENYIYLQNPKSWCKKRKTLLFDLRNFFLRKIDLIILNNNCYIGITSLVIFLFVLLHLVYGTFLFHINKLSMKYISTRM
jgi:hypothetical protein